MLSVSKEVDENIKIQTNETESSEHEIRIICKYLGSCFGASLPILNQN